MTPSVFNFAKRTCFAFLFVLAAVSTANAVEVEHVVSPGGIEAWLVEDHSNPIISLKLSFRGGSALDPKDKAGLANLVASTIDEGAGPLDSKAFQKELNDKSITLSFATGLDNFHGTLVALTEHRERAFELLRLALSEPRFDEEAVERIRAQILVNVTASRDDPDTIVGQTFNEVVFGDHPYAQRRDGTDESLAAIEIEDLKSFVGSRFARDNLIIGVVGDVTPEELSDLMDRTFSGLPETSGEIDLREADVSTDGGTVLVEMEIPQSVVVFGHKGMRRDNPDYYAAYIMNHILGGGSFSSRLFKEVREDRGLAYSVYSYLSPAEHGSIMAGRVATQNERVGESLSLIRAEWARMAASGPSEEELSKAKTFLTGSFPLRLSSSGAIADMLVGMQLQDLGIDYLERRNSLIETVTLDDVKRVAGELLQPDELLAVVVGNPKDVDVTERRLHEGG
ncbi:MAG: pitrilysin family protein [Kiloniellales bacterium]|nr:pitrilysin family protein [Kiloniellales bacterium]